jgi:hypothetical protein
MIQQIFNGSFEFILKHAEALLDNAMTTPALRMMAFKVFGTFIRFLKSTN